MGRLGVALGLVLAVGLLAEFEWCLTGIILLGGLALVVCCAISIQIVQFGIRLLVVLMVLVLLLLLLCLIVCVIVINA